MNIDIQALKSQLREYDKSLPKCQKTIEQKLDWSPDWCQEGHPDWESYQHTQYKPCCRPEGHDGECRNGRAIIGWPGYEVLKELIEIAEKAR